MLLNLSHWHQQSPPQKRTSACTFNHAYPHTPSHKLHEHDKTSTKTPLTYQHQRPPIGRVDDLNPSHCMHSIRSCRRHHRLQRLLFWSRASTLQSRVPPPLLERQSMMASPLREALNSTTKLATTEKCRTTSTISSAPAFLASPRTLGLSPARKRRSKIYSFTISTQSCTTLTLTHTTKIHLSPYQGTVRTWWRFFYCIFDW